MNINLVIIGILILYTLVFSLLVLFFYRKVNKYIISHEGDGLLKYLTKLENKEKANEEGINELEKTIAAIKKQNLEHVQKMGVVRFNPFSETGGDHSFTACLLDGYNNGFVITSLHTRERTRVYLKEVLKGEPNISLSKEEEKALKKALNKNE